jgi:hypothetical protein
MLEVLFQGKIFCRNLVMGRNIRCFKYLREIRDTSLTLSQGNFDSVLTPKIREMTA